MISHNIYITLASIFAIALFVSLAATPLAIKLAPRVGAIDIPKDERRMHTKAMPRFGGMAIFLGTAAAILSMIGNHGPMLKILGGGVFIYAIGVIDDIKGLKAWQKLICEVLAAVYLYMAGIRVSFVSNLFSAGHRELGAVLCFVITVIWIVGITNTVNLIDGLDGLAAGSTAISALCIAYVSYIHGVYYSTGAMLAIAGAALGFLPYNFYPAKIFMGDSGSLFLGYMLASVSILGTLKTATVVAVIIPVMVLGLPIFDTVFAIFRRLINRRPLMEADKGHLHHRLIFLGYGQRRATLMLYCVSGIMGIAATMMSRELWVEMIGLFAIAALMIYIFLTDANHKVPQIKNKKDGSKEDAEADQKKAEGSKEGTN